MPNHRKKSLVDYYATLYLTWWHHQGMFTALIPLTLFFLSPSVPIGSHTSLVNSTEPSIHTDLLNVIFSYSAKSNVFMCTSSEEIVVYEFVLTSQAVYVFLILIGRFVRVSREWQYSCCFLGCCFQDLFKPARNIFV